MTGGGVPDRLYGEKEIGRILKRATELQHDEPSAPMPAGMSLAELEEVALEAGIDPRYLRRAASELDTGGLDEGGFWAGVVGDALMLVRETSIPGELPDDGFERIVAVIQRNSREHGQPSMLGRTLTWRAETPGKTRTVQVTVTSRDGRTDIRAEESLHQYAGGLFGGTVAGAGVGVGMGVGVPIGMNVFGSALLATAFPIGMVGLTFIACREIYRQVVKGRRKRMGSLFEQVVEEARLCAVEKAIPASDASRLVAGQGDG